MFEGKNTFWVGIRWIRLRFTAASFVSFSTLCF